MSSIVIKLSRKNLDADFNGLLKLFSNENKLLDKNIGDITNISEYDSNLFDIQFVQINVYDYDKKINYGMLKNKSISDLKDFNIFRYIGNSKIDGYPLYLISDETCKSYNRDYILSKLGII